MKLSGKMLIYHVWSSSVSLASPWKKGRRKEVTEIERWREEERTDGRWGKEAIQNKTLKFLVSCWGKLVILDCLEAQFVNVKKMGIIELEPSWVYLRTCLIFWSMVFYLNHRFKPSYRCYLVIDTHTCYGLKCVNLLPACHILWLLPPSLSSS